MKVLNKLKGARVENGYNQTEMAEKLDMTVDSYNKKENGKYEFKHSEINLILEILGKDYDELFR